MKRISFKIIVMAITVSLITAFQGAKAQDPITLIIKEAVKKAIIAADLKIQRLQTKTIWLQNAQKVVENTMSKLKLDEVTDWVQKQKDLYKDYFEELYKVKDVLTYYHKVKEVSERQILLVKAYRQGWNSVQQDKHFSAAEVSYLGKVYTGIIEESLKNLDQMALVVNSFTTQMSDAKRMEIINRASGAIEQNYTDLKKLNQQNLNLSLQRSKDEHDIAVVKALYGIR